MPAAVIPIHKDASAVTQIVITEEIVGVRLAFTIETLCLARKLRVRILPSWDVHIEQNPTGSVTIEIRTRDIHYANTYVHGAASGHGILNHAIALQQHAMSIGAILVAAQTLTHAASLGGEFPFFEDIAAVALGEADVINPALQPQEKS